MSAEAYKQAITNSAIITEAQALQVALQVARSNPSIFNLACTIVGVGISASMRVQVSGLLEEGKPIEAIKLVRSMTKMKLWDAKKYVDDMK